MQISRFHRRGFVDARSFMMMAATVTERDQLREENARLRRELLERRRELFEIVALHQQERSRYQEHRDAMRETINYYRAELEMVRKREASVRYLH